MKIKRLNVTTTLSLSKMIFFFHKKSIPRKFAFAQFWRKNCWLDKEKSETDSPRIHQFGNSKIFHSRPPAANYDYMAEYNETKLYQNSVCSLHLFKFIV